MGRHMGQEVRTQSLIDGAGEGELSTSGPESTDHRRMGRLRDYFRQSKRKQSSQEAI